jgi:hypothetical protein
MLDALRSGLLQRGNARMFLVSASTIQKSLSPSVEALAGSLTATPPAQVPRSARDDMARARSRRSRADGVKRAL